MFLQFGRWTFGVVWNSWLQVWANNYISIHNKRDYYQHDYWLNILWITFYVSYIHWQDNQEE